jgi:hypothetical protein
MNPHCKPWARTGLKKRSEMILVVADWYEKSTVRKFGLLKTLFKESGKRITWAQKKRNLKSIYILLGQQMSRGISYDERYKRRKT